MVGMLGGLGMQRHGITIALVLGVAGCGSFNQGEGPNTGLADGGDDGEDPGVFGEEVSYELRLNEDAPPPLTLEMTREEVATLFGDSAHDVLLLELDSTPFLTNALNEIKSACGTDWQRDDDNPNHDCSLTALGQTFVGPDGTWRTSAEYALVRLLTMTPANVDVTGTSSETLQELADALGIGGGYGQILADGLGIARTDPIVSTASLVETFRNNFVASHPNTPESGALAITLGDALNNLSTVTERYGPMGDHPGIMVPDFPVHSEVFGPSFRMRATAESNLRLVDGVDLSVGKGFMSVVADTEGPTYDDEVEFDFTDPEKFQLSGIVDDLRVDMRFKIYEHATFIDSCLGNPPCQQNLPGSPVDSASVWAKDPWLLEYNIAAGGYIQYNDRRFVDSYLLGTAQVKIGQDGNPPGWIEYDIPLNIGNPPEQQWIWETILEVGQVALHSTPFSSIAEGQGDVEFTVRDIPVGMTGDQAAETVRPFLQEQRSKLSDVLLGDFKKNNDRLDFFFRRGSDGALYLFYIHESDLEAGETYGYEVPGFYVRSSLDPEDKVSDTVMTGLVDTTHEKFRLDPGETVLYLQDDEGQVFRARFVVPDGDTDEITVAVAPRVE